VTSTTLIVITVVVVIVVLLLALFFAAQGIRAGVVARSAGHAEEGADEDTTEELRQAIRKHRAVYRRLVAE
jgi:hypothetical protein